MFRSVFAFVLALLLAGAAHADDAQRAPKVVYLTSAATIGADGKLTALDWKTDNDAQKWLAARLDSKVRTWEFEPGTVDGVPVETRTTLELKLQVGVREDGGMDLRLLDASTGPGALAQPYPAFPPDGMKANSLAFVRVDLAVAADGSVSIDSLETETTGNRASFAKAMRAAFLKWRFEPEVVGGRALATHVVVERSFCKVERGKTTCPELFKARNAAATAAGEAVAEDRTIALHSAVKLKTAVRDTEI
jgi:hypothetical protein